MRQPPSSPASLSATGRLGAMCECGTLGQADTTCLWQLGLPLELAHRQSKAFTTAVHTDHENCSRERTGCLKALSPATREHHRVEVPLLSEGRVALCPLYNRWDHQVLGATGLSGVTRAVARGGWGCSPCNASSVLTLRLLE